MSLVLLANLLVYFDRSIGIIDYFFHKFHFFLCKTMTFYGYSAEKYHKNKSIGQKTVNIMLRHAPQAVMLHINTKDF